MKGIISAVFGLAAIMLVAVIAWSRINDSGVSGPLTSTIGIFFNLWPSPTEPELRSADFFALHEENFRFLLSGLSLTVVTLSGILGVMAAKTEGNSLWYAIGILSSATALAELSYIGAMLFLVLCGWLIMRSRNWKMPPA